MAPERKAPVPRTFFLNEQHELAHREKEGGGRLPQLAPIDWGAKGRRIYQSLTAARTKVLHSPDPLRDERLFVAAIPSAAVIKESKNKKKAPDGTFEHHTRYGGEDSKVFRRLGLDLIAVDPDAGTAVVHAPMARVEQLLRTSKELSAEGAREKARWVTIDSFDIIPASFRIDQEWLKSLSPREAIDVVVELQPLLTRVEVDRVIRAVVEALGSRANREGFTRMGTDFSGRHWFRGGLSRASLEKVANSFSSVQSLHPPLLTSTMAQRRSSTRPAAVGRAATPPSRDPAVMPCVAVVDTGVPDGHPQLSAYRRGRYVAPNAPAPYLGDHGSAVASRVVFGDPDMSAGVQNVNAECSYVDVNVADEPDWIDDKALQPALDAVFSTYAGVRVFNLSFGDYEALGAKTGIERAEKLILLRDLDNFIFARDVIVVVAAGNSVPGVVPDPNYPDHADVPEWALGSWACGFNALTCGSFVGRLTPGGLVKSLGWPSPFTRVGPGLCGAPVPDFAANGGNCTPAFQWAPAMGVWCCTAAGMWEDRLGTSFAAPLLAREAALALHELQQHCEQGAAPFAATVKAYLVLTAQFPDGIPKRLLPLAERTLGAGVASVSRLRAPSPDSAVLLWQGVLAGPQDVARVQVPIPRAWLAEAAAPELRVVVAWESPCNDAVVDLWASRRIKANLRPDAAGPALTGRGRAHKSYPLLDRTYDLSSVALEQKQVTPPAADSWVLELFYDEIADYLPAMVFPPTQRVGVALELVDRDEDPESPQPAMQALPQSVTMTRLTVPENRVANPVVVKTRV